VNVIFNKFINISQHVVIGPDTRASITWIDNKIQDTPSTATQW